MNNSGILFSDSTTQASRSDYVMRVYTSPATWALPNNLKSVKVTMLSGGGSGGAVGGATTVGGAGGGGGGGYAVGYFPAPAITAPLTVTVGAGGTPVTVTGDAISYGVTGGASSFGSLMTVTGGAGGAVGNYSPGQQTPPADPRLQRAAGGSGTTSPSVLAVPGQAAAGGFTSYSPGGDSALRYGFGGNGGPGDAAAFWAAPTFLAQGYGAGSGGAYPGRGTTPALSKSEGAKPGFVIVEEFY